ncbi:hypothetical protein ACO0RG_000831 [Hanseniaspora osmophila]|uniref:ATP synthase subunit 5, mitochondrial n=1 Tax=Hanseniaspora osmophila TaxID=56408 RepID=A0A1E5R2A0_9ASCO|nr:ATP synthase subunit 5, mitochondrial [Hanseniaspora osmophila]
MFTRSAIRNLATAAKVVKPPVQLFGLDGTYATALYTASMKASSIDATYDSLNKLSDMIKQDPKISSVLENPSLSQQERLEVVKILEGKIPKIDQSVSNFLDVLSANNRLSLLSKINSSFQQLYSAHNGVVEANVVSAVPLDSKILKRLNKAISSSSLIKEGQTLKISNIVNPDVQGGLVVEVGDRTADLSIATKINKLNQLLNETI